MTITTPSLSPAPHLLKYSEAGLNQQRSHLLHPLCLFFITWCGVGLLYSLHLSDLLIFSNTSVRDAIISIAVPFSLTCLLVLTALWLISKSFFHAARAERTWDTVRLDRRLTRLFWIWACFSCLEIITSGGVPLLWALHGTGKTYFDFGIPSIHGFLNSLIQALAITRVALYIKTRERKHLCLPVFVILWSAIVMTRNMMIVVLLEAVMLWLSFRRLRVATMLRLLSALIVFVLAFGLIGDARNSQLDIRALGKATPNFPEWLPSGVLWVYIYLTTPINNLVNTMQSKKPSYDLLFPETTALLFPSVVRHAIYGSTGDAFQGDLVSDNFNVSTGYTSPFQDFGYVGMVLYSAGIATVCSICWRRRNLRDTLIYSVMAQCLILTVFFNHFFALPIISQVFWIMLIFSRRKARFVRAGRLLQEQMADGKPTGALS